MIAAAGGPEGLQDATGFVLAGGKSSRMGSDKALLPLGGRLLIEHALAILRAAGLAAAIAGTRSPLEPFAPVIDDEEAGLGPLGGICTALATCPARWAVFLPVDAPLVPASLLVTLLDHARTTGAAVTIASVNGIAEPFPAAVDRMAYRALRAELEAGRGGCLAGFRAAAARLERTLAVLPAEYMVQAGRVSDPRGLPPVRWFLNANRPQDLERIEALEAAHRLS